MKAIIGFGWLPKIGSAYEMPPHEVRTREGEYRSLMPYHDADMVALQRALLRERKSMETLSAFAATGVALLAVFVGVLFLGGV